jgi:hypothetical protein
VRCADPVRIHRRVAPEPGAHDRSPVYSLSRDQSFAVLGQNSGFLLVLATGSIGTFIGGRLLGLVPTYFLLPLLAAALVMSAVKVWRHQ